ncbi:hydrogenase expression/formation protein HypD [Rhodopirellula maiorica SM1]|uniref:Hydrogenase expression/formation protein HypD n=1 Tax=Rhodopirellula maiorica SM1 TaxID=1265738 RepID=M5RJ96_9BACT|nr:hydrogenase formation protein HypD [Rhodopirellula maiorica]EMI19360.1 hydrogenase expression/formation protein HypD [Rhodopirellula maiorica SM1]
MKYQAEYRDAAAAKKLLHAIADMVTQRWTIMEVCGGQTHSIVRYGIDELLPKQVELVHGPGCPVCVTPLELIDKAIEIASCHNVIFCSFGDMLRVPGSRRDLFDVKASGGDVRIVYSPLDCLKIAEQNPNQTVVFFAVGFETTAPANAMAVWQAKKRGIENFAILASHVLVPPAIETILSSPTNRVQGFLGPGHVCSVMGYEEYERLVDRYQIPIVVTGFEPVDLLEGIYRCVRMLEQGEIGVDNQYARAVQREGSHAAQGLIAEVFEVTDCKWRGIGTIPRSGYRLRSEYQRFDAEQRFAVSQMQVLESSQCISGLILQGIHKPNDCPAFGKECTPEHPLGATMVSSEGACAAYYSYGRFLRSQQASSSERVPPKSEDVPISAD